MTTIARLIITMNSDKITNDGNSGVLGVGAVGEGDVVGEAVGLAVGFSVGVEVGAGVGLEREACEFKAMTMLWLLW
jgi:hypothetical protein